MTAVRYVTKKGMFDAVGMDALGYADPDNDEILIQKGLNKDTEKMVRHHESEHIKRGEEGPFLGSIIGAVGSLIGGSIANKGAKKAAEAAQYVPYNISGGFGSGTWSGQSGSASLAQPWAGSRDYYLNQMGFFNDQLGQFAPPTLDQYITGYTAGAAPTPLSYEAWSKRQQPNPFVGALLSKLSGRDVKIAGRDTSRAAYDRYVSGLRGGRGSPMYDYDAYNEARAAWKSPEERIYDRLALLSAEDEQLARNTLENRLFAQGMLGSTGGYQRSRALQNAQAQKALQREQYAVTLAEEIQNQIQRRGLNSLNAAIGLEQLPLDYLKLGGNVGIAGASAGANAASYLANAANNNADAISGFFGNLGSSLSPGVFTTPSTPSFNRVQTIDQAYAPGGLLY